MSGDLARLWGLTPHTALHLAGVLRAFPHTRVTSGRRSSSRNREVGGARRSFHLYGRAVDLVVPDEQLDQVVKFIRAQRVSPRCSGHEELIDEGDHLHVAW